jgi:hypothetical protein
MAGADARFAAGTLIEIDFKCVLLARTRFRQRNQLAIMPRESRLAAVLVVPARESVGGGKIPLFIEQFIDQRPLSLLFCRKHR